MKISPGAPKLGANVSGILIDLSVNGIGTPILFSPRENTSPPGINLFTSKYKGISSPRSEIKGVLIVVPGKKGIPKSFSFMASLIKILSFSSSPAPYFLPASFNM